MKRILLVSPFPPYIGGVSVSVQRLYDNLVKSGYEVVKFDTQLSVNSQFNHSSLKIVKFLSLPGFLLFHKHFDIIHFHVSNIMPKLYVSLWRFMFSRKTKFIITIHGQVTHTLNSKFGRYSLKHFDKIICVKKGDRQNMPDKLRSKTVEIPAFIPPVISGSSKIPCQINFHDRSSFKMLLNGFIINNDRFPDLYGFADAIRLLEQLRNRGKNAELVLIVLGFKPGKRATEYVKFLKNECRSRGIERFVCWIEGVTMELWPLLRKVDVLLRPTKSDGDALSIREALYMKIPVIASNVVPRPSDTVVYDINSHTDFLEKTISVIDNYEENVARIGENNINFASKIIEEYENQLFQKSDQEEQNHVLHLQKTN